MAGNKTDGSREEKLALKETIDEGQRKGNYKRIFPCIDFPYYKQFFEEHRPLNYYIDSKIYAKRRSDTASSKVQAERMPTWMSAHLNGVRLGSGNRKLPSSSPASGTDLLQRVPMGSQ